MNLLKSHFKSIELEVGCDEAGRGCLAGPVVAAAVIFSPGTIINELNDSKKLNEKMRLRLAVEIKNKASYYAIQFVDNLRIDEINILNASIEAMHHCLDNLPIIPQHIIVDGNKFKSYKNVPYTTIIKGDAQFQSIAAASILAKTARDAYMKELHTQFPFYYWNENKGYPTYLHKKAILENGLTKFHRRTFDHTIKEKQFKLFD